MKNWISYLNNLDDEKKAVVLEILNCAKKFSPNSVAEMPYGVPGLKLNGKPLIAVAAHKAHYCIYPFSPDVITKTKKLIGERETAKGTIRFRYGDIASENLIKQLVELRTKEII